MLPHRLGFLRLFDPKTGIDFAHFGLEWGIVFEGTTGVCERILFYRFNSKWVRKREKYANSKWIWSIFCFRSNLSNNDIISAFILLREKFLQFDWLRAVVFQLNLKYLHVTILFVIFGINTTSDISKLLYVISRAVRRVKFGTILKYHEWYLCQISRTNHAIICLYHYLQKVCNFHK